MLYNQYIKKILLRRNKMSKPLIVITGASSGFGAEIAKLFNADGFPMLLLGRRTDKIKALPLDFTNVLV